MVKRRLGSEQRIPLRDVPPLIPWNPAVRTVQSWCRKGLMIDGGAFVLLETEQAGVRGPLWTTREAVERFLIATGYQK